MATNNPVFLVEQDGRVNPESEPDSDSESEEWIDYFKFHNERDSPSDTRNALLVVAALIATVCFQAGIDPPDMILNKTTDKRRQIPPIYMFLICNSLGLSASATTIAYLIVGFPLQREVYMAFSSLMLTYTFAIDSYMKFTERTWLYNLFVIAVLVFPWILRFSPGYWKKARASSS